MHQRINLSINLFANQAKILMDIALQFVNDAPPGQIHQVYNGREINLDVKVLCNQTVSFEQHNLEQLAIANSVVLSVENRLDACTFYDPKTNTCFDVDHYSLVDLYDIGRFECPPV
jgi:hypothetical protein